MPLTFHYEDVIQTNLVFACSPGRVEVGRMRGKVASWAAAAAAAAWAAAGTSVRDAPVGSAALSIASESEKGTVYVEQYSILSIEPVVPDAAVNLLQLCLRCLELISQFLNLYIFCYCSSISSSSSW